MESVLDFQTIHKANQQYTIDLLDQLASVAAAVQEVRERKRYLFEEQQVLFEQRQILFQQRQALSNEESILLQEKKSILAQIYNE